MAKRTMSSFGRRLMVEQFETRLNPDASFGFEVFNGGLFFRVDTSDQSGQSPAVVSNDAVSLFSVIGSGNPTTYITVQTNNSDDGTPLTIGLDVSAGDIALAQVALGKPFKGFHVVTAEGDDTVAAGGLPFPLFVEGGDGNDTITGGNLADTLLGGGGSDSITGNGGNDVIYGDGFLTPAGSMSPGVPVIQNTLAAGTLPGQAGNDTIFGNSGNDFVAAGAGNDSVDGGTGNDTLFGQDGNDTITGGLGNDFITGDAGNDSLDGGAGNDTVDGGAGNDVVIGSAGKDSLIGGAGNDTVIADTDDVFVSGGPGTDKLTLTADGNGTFGVVINGGGFSAPGVLDENANGNGFENFDLAAAANVTYALTPAEIASPSTAFSGGTLNFGDTLSFQNSPVGLTINMNSLPNGLAGAGILSVIGTPFNDFIYGTPGNDKIDAGAGDDFVSAGDGNDTVYGGTGNDYIDGGAGDDVLVGETGTDTVLGGVGNDTLVIPFGQIGTAAGTNSQYLGSDGFDTFVFSGVTDADLVTPGVQPSIADLTTIRNYIAAQDAANRMDYLPLNDNNTLGFITGSRP